LFLNWLLEIESCRVQIISGKKNEIKIWGRKERKKKCAQDHRIVFFKEGSLLLLLLFLSVYSVLAKGTAQCSNTRS
jgi:hypothetical protein